MPDLTETKVLSAAADSEPVFRPTGQRNLRPARCAQCHRELARGQGRQWAYDFSLAHGTSYFCQGCHEYRLELLSIQPEIAQAMERVREWCAEYVTLGMGYHAYGMVDAIVGKCGLQGADVAAAIVERLPLLEATGYGDVVRLVRSIAAQLCGGPVDGGV